MSEKLSRAPKVLIVSNQQTTGPLWVFSLQQQQLNVLLESDPTQTPQRCEAESPDLIILDAEKPEAGPIATVKLPIRAAPQVHGWWVPEWQLPPPKTA